MAQRILVDQTDITKAVLDEAASPDLSEGEVRLKLESFALTANNVTYAAAGFVIGYWRFFPSGREGQGIVPVWGMARVVESRNEALVEGARLGHSAARGFPGEFGRHARFLPGPPGHRDRRCLATCAAMLGERIEEGVGRRVVHLPGQTGRGTHR